MTDGATANLADIFSVINEAVWSECRSTPQAAEARFWRAVDELRRQRITDAANDLLGKIGLMLFRLRVAAFDQYGEAEMSAIKLELNKASAACLRGFLSAAT